MKTDVYNLKGEKTGQADLPKEVFGLAMNRDLVHQVAVVQAANRRQNTAQTKDRSEVRGGGGKPWRQKGTGRARHGSIRSPLWKGGGVVFGPRKERNYKRNIPKQMKRKALFMVLSEKARKGLVIVLDELRPFQPKTKKAAELLAKLPCKKNKTLLALPKAEKEIILAFRNIPEIKTIEARELNPLDVLNFKYLLMPKESVKVIKETFLK